MVTMTCVSATLQLRTSTIIQFRKTTRICLKRFSSDCYWSSLNRFSKFKSVRMTSSVLACLECFLFKHTQGLGVFVAWGSSKYGRACMYIHFDLHYFIFLSFFFFDVIKQKGKHILTIYIFVLCIYIIYRIVDITADSDRLKWFFPHLRTYKIHNKKIPTRRNIEIRKKWRDNKTRQMSPGVRVPVCVCVYARVWNTR